MEDTFEAVQMSSLRVGRQYEIRALGFTPIEGYTPPYREFKQAMLWAIYHQPENYDPSHPSYGLNEELFDQIYKRLPRKWRKFLRFYIAIGSSFDQWHGIDAFFYLNGSIVTIDVTTNSTKQFKADLLATPNEMDPEKGRISTVFVQSIVSQLIRKYQLAYSENSPSTAQSS